MSFCVIVCLLLCNKININTPEFLFFHFGVGGGVLTLSAPYFKNWGLLLTQDGAYLWFGPYR